MRFFFILLLCMHVQFFLLFICIIVVPLSPYLSLSLSFPIPKIPKSPNPKIPQSQNLPSPFGSRVATMPYCAYCHTWLPGRWDADYGGQPGALAFGRWDADYEWWYCHACWALWDSWWDRWLGVSIRLAKKSLVK